MLVVRIIPALALLLAVLALSACGDAEEACQDFVDTVQSCGGPYASTYSNSFCAGVDEASCDAEAYFDCLTAALGQCNSSDFPDADDAALNRCTCN